MVQFTTGLRQVVPNRILQSDSFRSASLAVAMASF